MQGNENQTSKKTLAIVGFVFGVLTVIIVYLVIK
jgi:asparagine N-glycosylation enzyme membrane subunit Stt3